MAIEPDFTFDRDDPASYVRLGGYFFPILAQGHKWFRLDTFDIGTNEVSDLIEATRAANFLSFTKASQSGAHLTTISADFTWQELGLRLSANGEPINKGLVYDTIRQIKDAEWRYGGFELLSAVRESRHPTKLPAQQYFSEDIVDLATQGADKQGNKLFKRAGTIARAFRRVVASADGQFYVWIVDDPENFLEGWGFIHPRYVEFANENIWLPPESWNPVHFAKIVKGLDKLPISNARVVGRLIDVETDQLIDGHIKAQLAPGWGMPAGIDFIVPREAIKHELGPLPHCDWALAGLEPQGPKALFADRQTVNNHPFVFSRPTLRAELQDDATKAFRRLESGSMMDNVESVTIEEFDAPFNWNRESYTRMLRWTANAWRTYGMSYLDSRWMTLRLGMQWAQSLGYSDRSQRDVFAQSQWTRTLKKPMWCAMRIQVISEDAFNLVHDLTFEGGVEAAKLSEEHLAVPRGTMAQGFSKLPVMVVNNIDYRDILVPSHGGCDQDDFFLVLQREIKGDKKYLVFRNPNARGEYTTWDFWEGDEAWEHTMADGKKISFPPITKKRWPTQVLAALEAGETEYLPLPSSVDDTKTAQDDRRAVMAEQDRIMKQLRDERIPVDAMLKLRLGRQARDLPSTKESIFADSKATMSVVVREYLKRVREYSKDIKCPSYVKELGNNVYLQAARQTIRAARGQMFYTQQAFGGDTSPEVMQAMAAAEGAVLMAFVNQFGEDTAKRAQAIMALWYACWITPTRDGKITDQPIFATSVFREDPLGPGSSAVSHLPLNIMGISQNIRIWSNWPLLDALVFYGIAHPPGITEDHGDRGELVRQRALVAAGQQDEVTYEPPTVVFVKYIGNRLWNVRCKVCEQGYLDLSHKGLVRFQAHGGVCRECRETAALLR